MYGSVDYQEEIVNGELNRGAEIDKMIDYTALVLLTSN
jgi:hypothetical protein